MHVDYSTVTTKLNFDNVRRENSRCNNFSPRKLFLTRSNAQMWVWKWKFSWVIVAACRQTCMRGKMWQLQFECKWLSKYFQRCVLWSVRIQSFCQGPFREKYFEFLFCKFIYSRHKRISILWLYWNQLYVLGQSISKRSDKWSIKSQGRCMYPPDGNKNVIT